jgi:hypothetical protein
MSLSAVINWVRKSHAVPKWAHNGDFIGNGMFSNGGQYLAKKYLSEYDVVVPEILTETDGRGR